MTAQALKVPTVETPTGPMDFADMRALLDRLEHASETVARDAANAAAGAPPSRRRRQQRSNTMTGSNIMTFAEVLAAATDLGEQAGKGKDTQIKFLLKTTEAAFHGAIDLDDDKHGQGVNDATKLAEAYVKAQTGATIFDAKAPNQRKTISCVNTMIKLGMWPKGGPGEPLQTLNDLITIRQKLRQKPENAKRLDDAANTALRYARTQLKRDTVLSKAELEGLCFKPTQEIKTAEEVLESIRKAATALRDGKASHGHALDNSQEVQDIVKLCTKRLKAVAVAKAPQSGMATPSKQSTTAAPATTAAA